MREVSPGCTPKLTLSAGSIVVPPKGQTSISAKVELGCEPTDGQSIDFSIISAIPASVNPTYQTTNSDGIVLITFIAGEEEGMVKVFARSTVSYYTNTISAIVGGHSETINGPLITKELSKRINILIKEEIEYWSGNVIFNSYGHDFCYEYANYSIDFEFFVAEFDITNDVNNDFDTIFGTSSITQEVKLGGCIYDDCTRCDNMDAPSTLNLPMHGLYREATNTFNLSWYIEDGSSFYTYDYYHKDFPPLRIVAISVLYTGFFSDDQQEIPLVEDTYSGSSIISFHDVSYTLTLNKVE